MATRDRTTRIPSHHLAAELAAFPFASPASFELGVVDLDPEMKGAKSAALWRAAETQMTLRFPGTEVDEVVNLRDLVWFGHLDLQGQLRAPKLRSEPLDVYARRLAGHVLEIRDNRAIPQLAHVNEGIELAGAVSSRIARQAWWWLRCAMPAELLLAAVGSAARVETISPIVARILKENHFSETHLHIGAAMEFEEFWVASANAIAQLEIKSDDFHSPGAIWNEGRTMALWLVRAFIARYLLASHVVNQVEEDFESSITSGRSGWLQRGAQIPYWRLWMAIQPLLNPSRESAPVDAQGASSDWISTRADFGSAHLRKWQQETPQTFRHLQGVYRELTGAQRARAAKTGGNVFACDPIAVFLPVLSTPQCSPEREWMSRSLSYIASRRERKRPDELYERLFWQIQRVRNLFYRHHVQRPLTPGLRWFLRFYHRLRPVRERFFDFSDLLASAARVSGFSKGLKSLEVRSSVGSDRSSLLQYMDRFATEAFRIQRIELREGPHRDTPGPKEPELEIGLVVHFTKTRGGGADDGRPAAHGVAEHGNPVNRKNRGVRYGQIYRTLDGQADALCWLLRNYPLTVQWIRGIDVCADELAVPTWVIAPLFEKVRAAAGTAARMVESVFDIDVPRFGMTAHSGEGFAHLLSGIRGIDETINYLDLQEGDRVGHALALGQDPADWCQETGSISMPRLDRLFDLVWEWATLDALGKMGVARRLHYVEYTIHQLAEEIFGKGNDAPSIFQLAQLSRDLHDSQHLRAGGFPDGSPPLGASAGENDSANSLMTRFLTDPKIYRRGRTPMWVDTAHAAEALMTLQDAVRRKVASRGIVIEVNPASNLLIRDLGDMESHPLWRLQAGSDEGDRPAISICLGSDDPIVFAANLMEQYQFLFDAMTISGFSEEKARNWLDRARQCGLESRFTMDRVIPLKVSAYRLPLTIADSVGKAAEPPDQMV